MIIFPLRLADKLVLGQNKLISIWNGLLREEDALCESILVNDIGQ